MRFSAITENYYRIRLSPEDRDLLDIHFSGAAHHRARAFEVPNSTYFNFHFDLYYRHLTALMTLVYERGDFGDAIDPCREGMNLREHWNPRNGCPDRTMWDQLGAHSAFGLLESTYWDRFLGTNVKIAA